MNYEEIIKNLREPFLFEDIDWKVQVTSGDGTKGMAVPYLDSRAVQKRLDSAVGAFSWKNIYQSWHNNAQICGISIYDDEKKEWITKCDGAENSDFEPIKGGLSDAFKRAAVHWGIGRYLYELGNIWVEVEKKGKSTVIKDSEKPKLKPFYEKALAMLNTGTRTNQSPPSDNSEKSSETKPSQQTTQGGQTSNSQSSIPNGAYKIVELKPGSKNSTIVKLVSHHGEVVETYAKNDIQSIGVGGLIRNINMERKQNDFKDYNVLNGYEKAA